MKDLFLMHIMRIYLLQHEIHKLKNVGIQEYVLLFDFGIILYYVIVFSVLDFLIMIIILEFLGLDVLNVIVNFNSVDNVVEK
jgi:hypothetical protein